MAKSTKKIHVQGQRVICMPCFGDSSQSIKTTKTEGRELAPVIQMIRRDYGRMMDELAQM